MTRRDAVQEVLEDFWKQRELEKQAEKMETHEIMELACTCREVSNSLMQVTCIPSGCSKLFVTGILGVEQNLCKSEYCIKSN